MKRHFWSGVVSPALLMVLWMAPSSARADYIYTFTGQAGTPSEFIPNSFSISEPALFATTGPFSTSVTIDGTTFSYGYFDASNDCFAFGTAALANCIFRNPAVPGPYPPFPTTSNLFYGSFPGATGPGTYLPTDEGCDTYPCEELFSLTISETPEPSSLMLVGFGVLGLAGVLRRKLVR
jgi:PEP-CTERM motif